MQSSRPVTSTNARDDLSQSMLIQGKYTGCAPFHSSTVCHGTCIVRNKSPLEVTHLDRPLFFAFERQQQDSYGVQAVPFFLYSSTHVVSHEQ